MTYPDKKQNAKKNAGPVFPISAGCIEIGSNAIRMLAVSFQDRQNMIVLDSVRIPVRLGHSVFMTGMLPEDLMGKALNELSLLAARLRELNITNIRTVATSAVRESRNGKDFLSRIQNSTGLDVEVITGSEEVRLAHVAVRSEIQMGKKPWLLIDLGGGSVEVALVDNSGVLWSESHTMGSVRLLEELSVINDEEPGRFHKLVSEYISILNIPKAVLDRKPAGLIATGGNIEAITKLDNIKLPQNSLCRLSLKRLASIIGALSRLSYLDRVKELGLKEDRADVVLPAALVYQRIAEAAGMEEIYVPFVGVKEGLVRDIIDNLLSDRDYENRRSSQIITAAVSLGRKYMFDERHALHVAEMSMSFFDQTSRIHGLGDKDRMILSASAVLHDIGKYISFSGHHKHSCYIISNSQLPGFNESEMIMIAQIARYHRKGDPENNHELFALLPNNDQARVRKLSAILRLIDALDREHIQNVHSVRAKLSEATVTLFLKGTGDMLIEQWSLRKKSQLFRKVFCRDIRLKINSIKVL